MLAPSTPLEKTAVLNIHAVLVAKYGGVAGVRDEGLLDAALAQPFQTFAGVELYPGDAMKAARYAYGIIKNHPFADGNKRTGTAVIAAYLKSNGYKFKPRAEEMKDMIVGVAADDISFDELADWISSVLENDEQP